jgi:hypothetical protein
LLAAEIDVKLLVGSSLKKHNVTSSQFFLLDKSAPTFGEHIALATVPVGVSKPPVLARDIFKGECLAWGIG